MTEAEWLACSELDEMLVSLRDQASDRKLLLFAVACCRRIWPFLQPGRSRPVVESIERFVDGQTGGDDLQAASSEARTYADSEEARLTEISCSAAYAAEAISGDYPGERTVWIASRTADCVRNTCYWIAYEAASAGGALDEQACLAGETGEASEEAVQITLLRDIIGNPFLTIGLDPSWSKPASASFAKAIYDGRVFERMPELADALEMAGCTDAGVLAHCRGPGPHVRGCWVVDLILAKR